MSGGPGVHFAASRPGTAAERPRAAARSGEPCVCPPGARRLQCGPPTPGCGVRNTHDVPKHAEGHPRRSARHLRPEDLPPHLAHRVPGLGRPRSGRAVVVGLRPRRVLPDAGATPLPRRRPGARDGLHRLHHLLRVLADHRALPVRRRRVRGGLAAPRPALRGRLRVGAAGRLRAHHLGLDRRWRRRGLQLLAAALARAEAPPRVRRHRPPDDPEPARGEGVRHRPGAGVRAVPHHPRRPHPGRRGVARGRGAPGHPGSEDRLSRQRGRAGAGRRGDALPSRLLDGRRHLHRHRGGLERTPDHARAQGADRQEDHDLHGGVARADGRRHHARLPARPRHARRGQDDECGPGRALRRGLGALRPGLHLAHAGSRDGAALRGGAGGLHRRPPGHVEHGERLLAAAPVRPALRSPRDDGRHPPHRRRVRRDPPLHAW